MRELHQRLSDLKFSLEEMQSELQREQDDSEVDHTDWENRDEADADEDEPEVIDNSESIDRYERAINLLSQAMTVLDND